MNRHLPIFVLLSFVLTGLALPLAASGADPAASQPWLPVGGRYELERQQRLNGWREGQSDNAARIRAEREEREAREREAAWQAQQIALQLALIQQQQAYYNSPAYQCQLEAQRRERERQREIMLSRIKHNPYPNR